MPITQTVTCDCCAGELADTSVTQCVIVTALEDDGSVLQHYFCITAGCAAAVRAFVAAMPADHASHAV